MSDLGKRWLVVSPHLDDAVLSLGASMTANARAGGTTTVVTVFAGDPTSTAAAGRWDVASGFRSAAEATSRRRVEDERACRIVRARAVHVDGVDEQYDATPTDWDRVRALVPGHDIVFVPGSPLSHADHRRLASEAMTVLSDVDLREYGEEPYLLYHWRSPDDADLPDGREVRWHRHPSSWADVARKLRAVTAYRSQLRLLARPLRRSRFDVPTLRLLARFTRRARQGEWIAVVR